MSDSRGNVTLRLPQTSYQNARVSLYSVNGKRIISHKVDASASAKRISTPNAASGIYILSVKGISGGSFSGRLSHKGGKLNIGVSFGAGEAVFPLMKDAYAVAQNDNEDAWTIRVTAVGYTDSTYQFTPEIGMNSVHNITLRRELETMGSFTDSRDGKTYGWVLMPDGKRWMAQNLNYDTLDGTGSWCYENSADSCVKYGRLYNWAAAMDIDASFNNTPWNGSDENHQGICPVGWRLPSHADWNALMAAVGGEETAGTKLKSQTGWYDGDSDYIPGTDDYGFSALPGGRRWNGGSFGGAGYLGHWWSASEDNSGRAYGRDMNYGIQDVFSYWLYKSFGFSVRCLRD
ncbi:MAG: T9SS type A sorting domain-containing protein [Chitinispirillales bacterium]|nr:T9SS type A sorting domain-containing protein [Chitinispirillales bacterium]